MFQPLTEIFYNYRGLKFRGRNYRSTGAATAFTAQMASMPSEPIKPKMDLRPLNDMEKAIRGITLETKKLVLMAPTTRPSPQGVDEQLSTEEKEKMAEAILEALDAKQDLLLGLEELRLSNTKITQHEVNTLSELSKSLPNLKVLNLSNNEIDDVAGGRLYTMIVSDNLPQLKTLVLTDNRMNFGMIQNFERLKASGKLDVRIEAEQRNVDGEVTTSQKLFAIYKQFSERGKDIGYLESKIKSGDLDEYALSGGFVELTLQGVSQMFG